MSRTGKWVAAFALAVIAGQAVALSVVRRRVSREHLAALNAEARASETTRVLRGALAVSRRQVEQLTVELDRTTHERDEKGTALARLEVRFDSLSATTTGEPPVVLSNGFQLAGRLDAREKSGVFVNTVVHVRADSAFTLPEAATVSWEWNVRREPLELAVDFSCRRDTALVHVAGPTWANATIMRAVQDPRFCNPPPPVWKPFEIRLPSVPVAAGLIGVGWILRDLVSQRR